LLGLGLVLPVTGQQSASQAVSYAQENETAKRGPVEPIEPPERGKSKGLVESLPVAFEDVTVEVGVDFYHHRGRTPQKYLPETMGAGGMFFDFDGDGWLDIFLVDSGSVADTKRARGTRHALYRNRGDGTYSHVSPGSGIEVEAYGQGVCAADYDNDGDPDIYLANFGPNQLYRNNGDGTFTDVTEEVGVGNPRWGSSCAFGDIENDGDLDLYVVNYVDFGINNNKFCGDYNAGVRAYCHPHVYNGNPDVLYRNNGDGTFSDVSHEAGVHTTAGKGLGVVFGDYNNDGWIDIYVANDSVPNFLYQNQGDGTFKDIAMWAGAAVNGDGRPEAGMGTDMADYDGDGLVDLIATNLDMETNTLYRNIDGSRFEDVTFGSGHAEASLRFVGFGATFVDYDNDGDLDVIVANGNNDDGHDFKEVAATAGPGFRLVKVSRGLAAGDIDNDGDLDLLITNNGQTPDLLRNDGGNQRHALLVRTVGTKSNRDGVGARLKLTAGRKTQMRHVKAGASYQSQSDLRVHFGLGEIARVDRLEVEWPSGMVDVLENIDTNQIITVVEGRGLTASQPLHAAKSPRPARPF
jgi:hypothetical protein